MTVTEEVHRTHWGKILGRGDWTDFGGDRAGFPDTERPLLAGAQTEHPGRRKQAMGTIAGLYWKPLYCYLRAKGNSDADAKDLVQGFFCENVLQGGVIKNTDLQKGRFRTFLLTSLQNYVRQQRRGQMAKKRFPAKGLVSLGAADEGNLPYPSGMGTPEQQYICAWAISLVHAVLTEVKTALIEDDEELLWTVFLARVVRPMLEGTEPVSEKELCREYNIPHRWTVERMVVRVRKIYASILRSAVRQYAGPGQDVEREIRDLIRIVSDSGAASSREPRT